MNQGVPYRALTGTCGLAGRYSSSSGKAYWPPRAQFSATISPAHKAFMEGKVAAQVRGWYRGEHSSLQASHWHRQFSRLVY